MGAICLFLSPLLLSIEEYVSHSNPALGQFPQSHPEVAPNSCFSRSLTSQRTTGGAEKGHWN